MKNLNRIAVIIVASSMFAACSKMDFSAVAQGSKSFDVPPDVPVTPPPASSSFKLSNGACKSDSSTQILSCLKCDVPQIVAKPQLSAKAQALHDAMLLSCQISNKSDKNNFRPTEAMILNKLNRASDANYPETARTPNMTMVIEGLTNPNDNSLRKKMFGGLWYQPPYSDAFETYFGITVQEAKSVFCWNGDQMNGVITDVSGLMSKEYMDCQYSDNSFNCKETPAYVAAYGYRNQLQNSLKLGVTNPYTAPAADPQKSCSWDKFEGDDLVSALVQLRRWKAEGRKVSLSLKNSSGAESCGDATEANLKPGSTVQLATYKCN
jgi:hypothetical protein